MELVELLYCETYLEGGKRKPTYEWYVSSFPIDHIKFRSSSHYSALYSALSLKTTLSLIKKKNWALVDQKKAFGVLSIIDCDETFVGVEKIIEELLK